MMFFVHERIISFQFYLYPKIYAKVLLILIPTHFFYVL